MTLKTLLIWRTLMPLKYLSLRTTVKTHLIWHFARQHNIHNYFLLNHYRKLLYLSIAQRNKFFNFTLCKSLGILMLFDTEKPLNLALSHPLK